MADNVVELGNVTTLDLPAERVIQRAKDADLETVIVIGKDQDGDFWFASNKADGGTVLWFMEVARKRLMEIGDSG